METLERELKQLREDTDSGSVESALSTVRTLAGKSKGVPPANLLAAVEHLSDVATRVNHSEADFYRGALKEARQHDEASNFRHLIVRLLGSSVEKKIAASVDSWRKVNKSVGGAMVPSSKGEQGEQKMSSGAYSYQFPHFVIPKFDGAGYGPPMNRGRGRGFGGRGRGFGNRGPLRCFWCNEIGHVMENCQAAKEARQNSKK